MVLGRQKEIFPLLRRVCASRGEAAASAQALLLLQGALQCCSLPAPAAAVCGRLAVGCPAGGFCCIVLSFIFNNIG